MRATTLLPALLLIAIPTLAAQPAASEEVTPARRVTADDEDLGGPGRDEENAARPLLFREVDGRLEVRSADFLQPVQGPAAACDGSVEVRTLGEWQALETAPALDGFTPSAPGDLSRVSAASVTGYTYCDCTLAGITAYASTCAPDCGSDCDEGHDGTTCHVHQYYRAGSGTYRTFIDDFVDCCECSPLTANDCGNSVNTYDCGACAGDCPWPGEGHASCCVYHFDLFARQRKVETSHSVASRVVRIRRGTTSSGSNQIRVTQGGRESCDGGSRDGWQSYSFPPDRSVSSFRVGASVHSTWSCAATAPTLSGSGFSCTCYQDPSFTCTDGYCDRFTDPDNDPDCVNCSIQDGYCFPGCESYPPDPDCCDDPSKIDCTQ